MLRKSRFIEMFGTLSQNSASKKTTLGKWISINPKKEKLSTDLDITFLPMASVSNDGKIIYYTTRKSGECEKGFIQFKDEDVLFAKITPCMENGKGCVAQSLNNGYGYGTTEFIVLRSNKKIINPFWLHYLISTTEFRNDAAKHMTGTAGQKRVPPSYFSDFKFNLPPIELQNKYVEEFLQIDKLKFILQQKIEKLELLKKSRFIEMFGDPNNPTLERYPFLNLFKDDTKKAIKISQSKYLNKGLNIIIDQGDNEISGYINESQGLYENIPTIVFGDHTRRLKYIKKPFFLGADGAKILVLKDPQNNVSFMYYQLTLLNLPNAGYSRHYKFLKESYLIVPEYSMQFKFANELEQIDKLKLIAQKQLDFLVGQENK